MKAFSQWRFVRETDGGLAVWGLIMVLTICVIVGLSMDVANAYKVRSEMQVAADTAGHTALLTRLRDGKEQAITNAVNVANKNLEVSKATGAITAADIVFGTWDVNAQVFTPNPNATSAVMVTAKRNDARANGVGTFLLGFVGLKAWNVTTASVSETYRPACLREGFVADKLIDLQSNNGFYNGFCLHSNGAIEVNQNNVFESGTIVSLPNTDNLELPASGFTKNTGLLEALRENFYQIRIVDRIPEIIASLASGAATYKPDYITTSAVESISVTSNSQTFSTADFVQGHMYYVSCSGNKTLKVAGNVTLKKVTVMTNCAIDFGSDNILEDVVMGTTNTSDDSIKWASNFQVGKNDHCATGGGAQLLTMGGMKSAAALKAFGAQLLAKKSINFTANADGIEGASFISGDTVSGTSNMTMGLCNSGMEDNFEVDYYRLAY